MLFTDRTKKTIHTMNEPPATDRQIDKYFAKKFRDRPIRKILKRTHGQKNEKSKQSIKKNDLSYNMWEEMTDTERMAKWKTLGISTRIKLANRISKTFPYGSPHREKIETFIKGIENGSTK